MLRIFKHLWTGCPAPRSKSLLPPENIRAVRLKNAVKRLNSQFPA